MLRVLLLLFFALCGVANAQLLLGVTAPNTSQGSGGGGGGTNPVADIDFSSGSAAAGCITTTDCLSVTRTTTETCEPPGGTLSYATSGNPCITTAGLHTFGAVANLQVRSQDPTSGWTTSNGTFTVAGTAPDGNATGMTLTDNSTNGQHRTIGTSIAFTSGTVYTFSFFAKAGTCGGTATVECHTLQVQPNATTFPVTAILQIELNNCSVAQGAVNASDNWIIDYRLTAFANGWCKIAYQVKATSSASAAGFQVNMTNQVTPNAAVGSYAGQTSTILLWGFNVAATTAFRPYCPSTTGTSTCNADVITDGGSNTALKTALEASALRILINTAAHYNGRNVAAALLGVGTTLYGLGVDQGYRAQTSWPTTATLASGGQILQQRITTTNRANNFGLSADASGRSLVLNGQTATSDSNGLSASTLEYIGALSDGSAPCDCIISRIRVWSTRNDSQIATDTANTNALALLNSYVGPVATNVHIAQNTLAAGTAILGMSRSHHRFIETVTNAPQIQIPNYYVQNNVTETEIGNGGVASGVSASIEFPVGTCTQLTVSSASTWTIANAGTVTTDTGIALPQTGFAGGDFWIRIFRKNASGIIFQGYINSDIAQGEAMHSGTSSISDQTVSCDTVTATAIANQFSPSAIVGPTQLHSYCLLGDSRNLGFHDLFLDGWDLIGENVRWVGAFYSHINMGAGGDQAVKFLASNTNRLPLLAYCTGLMVNLGVNDIYTSSSSAATLEANLASVYALKTNLHGGTGPVWQTTISNKTSSTDTFATTGNQTIVSGGTTIDTINGWIRANTAGITGFYENETVCQTASTAQVWNATGFINGWTSDGLHGQMYCYLSMQTNQGFQLLQ